MERVRYDNLCKSNIKYDSKNIYTRQREIYNPWFPELGLLHVSKLGIFKVFSRNLEFTPMGENKSKVIKLTPSEYGIPKALLEVTEGRLTFEDIMIILNEEFTKLFRYVSATYLPLSEYPDILEERSYPNVMYICGKDFYIFNEFNRVGFKSFGMSEFLSVSCDDINFENMLTYVALSAGYYYTKEGIYEITKRSNWA